MRITDKYRNYLFRIFLPQFAFTRPVRLRAKKLSQLDINVLKTLNIASVRAVGRTAAEATQIR